MQRLFALLAFASVVYGELACPCASPDWCKPLSVGPRKEFFVFGSSGKEY